MNSREGLSRIMSAILATSSVIGQISAAPKKKSKVVPVAINKVGREGKNGRGLLVQGRWYKSPHNWFDFGAGSAATGLGFYLLSQKRNRGSKETDDARIDNIKLCDTKLGELANIAKDEDYAEFFDYSCFSVVETMRGFYYTDCVAKENELHMEKSIEDLKKAGIKDPTFFLIDGAIRLSKMDDVGKEPDLKDGFGVLYFDGCAIRFAKGGYLRAVADLLSRSCLTKVCMKKGYLSGNDDFLNVSVDPYQVVLSNDDFVDHIVSQCREREKEIRKRWEVSYEISDYIMTKLRILLSMQQAKSGEK